MTVRAVPGGSASRRQRGWCAGIQPIPCAHRTAAPSLSLIAVAVLAACLTAAAASPVFWRVSTQADFLAGEADNISIDADGRLLLGPGAETVHEVDAPFLWTLVRSGDALWIGGGSGAGAGGVVHRIDPDGTATMPLEADAADVHALAPRADGGVYTATSPGGRVLVVGPDGTTRDLFDPDEPYVWALAADAEGELYVGTGNPGRIYRVAPDGTAALVYDTGATHVRVLALDPEGRLLAGAGSPGHLFRIDTDGEAFVLLDSGREEIVSLRVEEDGTILAAAAGRPSTNGSGGGASTTPAASTGGTATASAGGTATAQATTAATAGGAGTAQPGGAVYRIAPDGIWDVVWESTDETPYDVIRDADGGVVVGTGPNGAIYRVAGEPAVTVLLTRARARQVTSFSTAPDGRIAWVTANPGALHRMAIARAGEGTYTSVVHDAGTVATWGTIRWRATTPAGSDIQLQTRSGNTETPGDTWSRWSGPYDTSDGAAIVSPKARYLQWRAQLRADGATPALRSVTAAYLPRNLAPEITRITLHDPGRVYQQTATAGDPPIAGLNGGRDPATPPTGRAARAVAAAPIGRQVYRKGLQAFAWDASDPNGDPLRYEVRYRAEAAPPEAGWQVLAQDLAGRLFTWDTTSAPDGTYVVRIVASDLAANAPGDALTAVRDTAPFDVDNTPPRITIDAVETPAGTGARVRFTVTDAQSAVNRVEYALDADTWQVIYPIDGIPDAPTERFELDVPAGALDRLVLRVTDAMDNTATADAR